MCDLQVQNWPALMAHWLAHLTMELWAPFKHLGGDNDSPPNCPLLSRFFAYSTLWVNHYILGLLLPAISYYVGRILVFKMGTLHHFNYCNNPLKPDFYSHITLVAKEIVAQEKCSDIILYKLCVVLARVCSLSESHYQS